MEYSSKKKNTHNFYQSKNDILEYDDNDAYSTDTIIGSYIGVQTHDNENDNINIPIKYKSSITSETFEDEQQPCSFDDIKYIYKNFKIYKVNMNYYPFNSQHTEDSYKMFYKDVALTLKCPACNYFFDEKIYVIDNYILLCDTCYKCENSIKYI